tara:strand:- start:837 stop:947 length:111 start_codon:yes stop_codon:yes gene_type:complete
MLSVCFEITNFGYSIDYLLHGRQTKKEEDCYEKNYI